MALQSHLLYRRHVLFSSTSLGLPRPPLSSHFLILLPHYVPPLVQPLLTQMFFERFHLPAVLVITRELASLYGAGANSGLVIDIGDYAWRTEDEDDAEVVRTPSSLVPIFDGDPLFHNAHSSPLTSYDLDLHFAHLLLTAIPTLPSQLSLSGVPLLRALTRIISSLKSERHLACDLHPSLGLGTGTEEPAEAEDEEGITDVAKALASGKANKIIENAKRKKSGVEEKKKDTVEIDHPAGKENGKISVPIPLLSRYMDPLLKPEVLKDVRQSFAKPDIGLKNVAYSTEELQELSNSVLDAAHYALDWNYSEIETGMRAGIRDTIVIAGVGSTIKGFGQALVSVLPSYVELAESPDVEGETKPFNLGRLADYFSGFRGREDCLAFLGGCIIAKLGFNDSSYKLVVTKQDYNALGPQAGLLLESS
ncbi:hypothetical protein BT69DRAFT_1339333 [Atractiella rhizophila]|nr:hypothetical protein BT69DRAFT_1339333 [Atractiella rhizophila]